MKKKKIEHPDKAVNAFPTGAYSPGIEIDGWLYVSGQGPFDFKTSQYDLGTIEDETTLTLHNIRSILGTAGCSMDDIVKCTVHLSDIGDFDKFDQVYSSYFRGLKPARTTVQSVLGDDIKIEIDAIARVPEKENRD